MLGLAEYWKSQIFFIQDFTLVNICRSLYGTRETQTESQNLKKSQHSAKRNLPNYFMIIENKKM